ncbi:MAG: hypothetical protein WCG26_00455 [Chloroflexales bacterium]
MPQVASDIIVTGARIFVAPVGSTLPAPSLAAGATWPTGWVDVGFTLEATKLNYKFDVLEIFVEQTMSAVARRRTKEEISIETVLAEHTAGNLALALAAVATTSAATSTVVGYEQMTVGGNPDLPLHMIGIEGGYNDADSHFFPIRLFLWRATVADGGTLEYGKDKPAGIPLKLNALADTAKPRNEQLLSIVRVTAPITV